MKRNTATIVTSQISDRPTTSRGPDRGTQSPNASRPDFEEGWRLSFTLSVTQWVGMLLSFQHCKGTGTLQLGIFSSSFFLLDLVGKFGIWEVCPH